MKKYIFLDYLRVLALGMIIFDHLGMYRNPKWYIGNIVCSIICKPLHIIQYFEAFGVVLFFLISGFLFANSIEYCNKNKLVFFFHKFIQIYIPLLLSFFSFYIFQEFASEIIPGAGYWRQFSNIQWLKSATLLGWLTGDGDVINGTTWYLVPLLLFYGLGTLLITKRKNKFKTILCLFGSLLLGYGINYIVKIPILESLIINSWYLTLTFIGVILFYFYQKMLKLRDTLILLGIDYLLCVYGVYNYSNNFYYNEPYLVSAFYAVILFCLVIYFRDCFKENKFIMKFSKLSYYIYLVHMTYGSLLLSVMENKFIYTFVFLIVCILVIMIASLHKYFCKEILGIENITLRG